MIKQIHWFCLLSCVWYDNVVVVTAGFHCEIVDLNKLTVENQKPRVVDFDQLQLDDYVLKALSETVLFSAVTLEVNCRAPRFVTWILFCCAIVQKLLRPLSICNGGNILAGTDVSSDLNFPCFYVVCFCPFLLMLTFFCWQLSSILRSLCIGEVCFLAQYFLKEETRFNWRACDTLLIMHTLVTGYQQLNDVWPAGLLVFACRQVLFFCGRNLCNTVAITGMLCWVFQVGYTFFIFIQWSIECSQSTGWLFLVWCR